MVVPKMSRDETILRSVGGLIGFCGAGGTGKTTTAQLLSETHSVPLLPSSTRGVFKMLGLETEADQEKLDGEGRKHLQRSIQDTFYSSLMGYPRGVSDRTPLDHWCYMLYYCGDYMSEEEVGVFRRRTAEGLKRFAYVFYFPLVTYPTHEDGMRKNGYGYRKAYDYLMQAAILDFGVQVYTMRRGQTPQQHVEHIWQFLASRAHLHQ
jgi:hypothetical protein